MSKTCVETLSWSFNTVMPYASFFIQSSKGQHEPGITTLSQALSRVLMIFVLNLCHDLTLVYLSRGAPQNSLALLNQERNLPGYI
jgi:hypothetical protein